MNPPDLDAITTPSHGDSGHGHHVPLPKVDAERLQWWPVQSEQRERELRWTCECRATQYGLITGGGYAWIRRRTPSTKRETVRMHPHAAALLWLKVLAGEAV